MMAKRGMGHGITNLVNIDIQIIIDVTEISSIIFAAWLIRSVRASKRNTRTRVNGKDLPENDADAITFVAKEIENKK